MQEFEQLRQWLRYRYPAYPYPPAPDLDQLPELPDGAQLRSALGGGTWAGGARDRMSLLLAVARDGTVEQRAAALDALAEASASWWTVLDEVLRHATWTLPRWTMDLGTAVLEDRADLLDLVVAACHNAGRLREAAVARLRGRDHPVAAAVLALRTTDHVPQIADAARTGCERLLAAPIDGRLLVVMAALAEAMRERVRGAWLRDRTAALLPGLPDEILAHLLRAGDRRVRRGAYRTALAAGRLPVDALVRAALRDADVTTRLACANAALAAAPDFEVARRLLASRTPLIRSEAVRLLARAGELGVAEAALSDRSWVVRFVAQTAYRRDVGDPAARYRELLSGGDPEPGAISGLVETGTPDDADLIARWLTHSRPQGRVAALKALGVLGAVRADRVAPLLGDPSPAVLRQSAAALEAVAQQVDAELLAQLLDPGRPAATRLAAYRLGLARGPWPALLLSLRLLAAQDPQLLAAAREQVAAWPGRPGARAYRGPGALAAELDTAIEQARPFIGDRHAELLRFMARG